METNLFVLVSSRKSGKSHVKFAGGCINYHVHHTSENSSCHQFLWERISTSKDSLASSSWLICSFKNCQCHLPTRGVMKHVWKNIQYVGGAHKDLVLFCKQIHKSIFFLLLPCTYYLLLLTVTTHPFLCNCKYLWVPMPIMAQTTLTKSRHSNSSKQPCSSFELLLCQ